MTGVRAPLIAHDVGTVLATDLFLSYSRRESKEFVARVAAALEARAKDAWVDLEDIPPASQFMEDLVTVSISAAR